MEKGYTMRSARFAPLMLMAALGGCINLGLGSAKVPPALWTLTAQSAPVDGSSAGGRPETALSVMEPDTPAKLAVVRVAVTIDPTRVAYLRNAQWVERPSRLFQHMLAETLRAHGQRLVSEGDGMTRGAILSGRLFDFGYDASARAAVVRFDAIRRAPDGTVDSHRFEARVDGIDAEPDHVGPALNQAANQVAKAVTDWIG